MFLGEDFLPLSLTPNLFSSAISGAIARKGCKVINHACRYMSVIKITRLNFSSLHLDTLYKKYLYVGFSLSGYFALKEIFVCVSLKSNLEIEHVKANKT